MKTSSLARSRLPAPSARAIAEVTPAPIPLLVVCRTSITNGNASEAPASALVPMRPRKKPSKTMTPTNARRFKRSPLRAATTSVESARLGEAWFAQREMAAQWSMAVMNLQCQAAESQVPPIPDRDLEQRLDKASCGGRAAAMEPDKVDSTRS